MSQYTKDNRIDGYINSLPAWQSNICKQLREIIHEADMDITETIKFTNRPYFILNGNVCSLLAAKKHINLFIYTQLPLTQKASSIKAMITKLQGLFKYKLMIRLIKRH